MIHCVFLLLCVIVCLQPTCPLPLRTCIGAPFARSLHNRPPAPERSPDIGAAGEAAKPEGPAKSAHYVSTESTRHSKPLFLKLEHWSQPEAKYDAGRRTLQNHQNPCSTKLLGEQVAKTRTRSIEAQFSHLLTT